MINTAAYEARNRVLNPSADLVRIFRVSLLQAISPTPGTTVLAVPHAIRASVTPSMTPTTPSLTTAALASASLFSTDTPILSDDVSVLD